MSPGRHKRQVYYASRCQHWVTFGCHSTTIVYLFRNGPSLLICSRLRQRLDVRRWEQTDACMHAASPDVSLVVRRCQQRSCPQLCACWALKIHGLKRPWGPVNCVKELQQDVSSFEFMTTSHLETVHEIKNERPDQYLSYNKCLRSGNTEVSVH